MWNKEVKSFLKMYSKLLGSQNWWDYTETICVIIAAYVEVGPDTGATATLAFTFGTSTLSRSWDIKVTQLECSSTSRPASGCLQYFTQSSGRIESYNFPGDAATPSIQQHLHSQK